jgi:hypothetical protein
LAVIDVDHGRSGLFQLVFVAGRNEGGVVVYADVDVDWFISEQGEAGSAFGPKGRPADRVMVAGFLGHDVLVAL